MPNTQPEQDAMRQLGIGETELLRAIERGELCEYCCCPLDRCECGEVDDE